MKTKFGILFDFDGTLANSLRSPFDAYHSALAKVGVQAPLDQDIRKYFGIGADRIFEQLVPDPVKAKQAFENYLEFGRTNPSATEWHESVPALLEKIRAENIPTAIVTGRHSRDLEIVATSLGLQKYFGVQICDDYLSHSKPHPEGIILAASRIGVEPNQVLYVGDSLGDMEAAKAAGAMAVAALWDHSTDRKRLSQLADFVAETPDQVWDFFKGKAFDGDAPKRSL
jgi:HAD superfamily hydrolase (TIGR01549 family)